MKGLLHYRLPPSWVPDALVQLAAAHLERSGLVIAPTETSYLLGAGADDCTAVDALIALKGRGQDKTMSIAVLDAAAAAVWGRLDQRAMALIERFWPGPLTLVVPATGVALARLHAACVSPAGAVALRSPREPFLAALLRRYRHPLTATSANRSGGPEPTSVAVVRALLAADATGSAMFFDAGDLRAGLPSTVLDLSVAPARILRSGPIGREEIARIAECQ
ncbi:MAG: threonylcarbamoyl-AMP synthase [Candidatus Schekmanbacteria bacterium]|nr:threonylcarbamoyl-AMP synthase [Candidatus Schekmanbacteria bacterium]